MTFQFYCISLPVEVARREAITRFANSAGIELQFIEAVWGKSLQYDEVRSYDRETRLKYRADMSLGEIGCVLSHQKALLAFMETDATYAVVLEDDAIFDADLLGKLNTIVSHFSDDLIDMVKLDSAQRLGPSVATDAGLEYFASEKVSLGTIGLLYTRRGAEKVLKSLEHFRHAYDRHLGFGYQWNLVTVAVWPRLIRHDDEVESSIGNRKKSRKYFSLSMLLRDKFEGFALSRMKKRYAQQQAEFLKSIWR